jgi:hypothetical protein
MALSNQSKFLLLVAGVVALIFFLNSSSSPIHNEGALAVPTYGKSHLGRVDVEEDNNTAPSLPEDPSNIQEEKLHNKFRSKNRSYGSYKSSNYVEGKRGNGPSNFDDYFDVNNDLISESQKENNEFNPRDESEGKLAGYKGGKKREITDEEIFKSDDYLPKEQSKDWFEVMPDPISSSNRHLINTTRVVGLNSVGTSKKNASYDLRGCPLVNRTVVSPWLQSSIEPDLNNRGFCN